MNDTTPKRDVRTERLSIRATKEEKAIIYELAELMGRQSYGDAIRTLAKEMVLRLRELNAEGPIVNSAN